MAVEARAEVRIAATGEEVWAVVMDFEAYPEWSKIHRAAAILEHDEHGWPHLVRATTKIAGIKETQTVRYTWYDDSATWELVEGTIQRAQDGTIVVHDNGDGTTDVEVSGAVDLIIPVPGRIIAMGQKMVLNVVQKGLKQRVESLV